MKKSIILLFALLLIMSSTIVFAEETEKEKEEITTRVAGPCPIAGTHDMLFVGTGRLYNNPGTAQDPLQPTYSRVVF